MNKPKLAILFAIAAIVISTFLSASVAAQNTSVVPDPPTGKGVVVLKAARLIDGTGKAEIQNGVVVVTDNMITAVGSAEQVAIPAGAKVIDLGDAKLMPGFIDNHKHDIGRILGAPSAQQSPRKD